MLERRRPRAERPGLALGARLLGGAPLRRHHARVGDPTVPRGRRPAHGRVGSARRHPRRRPARERIRSARRGRRRRGDALGRLTRGPFTRRSPPRSPCTPLALTSPGDRGPVAPDRREQVAWVESPLQFLAAAEYAAAHDRRISVAFRLTGPQMTSTAEELLERGAPFTECVPYFGVPWSLLARTRDWIVGDGVLRAVPRGDEHAGRPVGDARRRRSDDRAPRARARRHAPAYARPGGLESRAKTRARRADAGSPDAARGAGAAHAVHRVRGGPGGGRPRSSRRRGRAEHLRLDARERTADRAAASSGRARQRRGDRRDDRPGALPRAGSSGLARSAPLSYLPHRRESPEQLDWVSLLPGVELVRTGLPVELVLAGSPEPLELVTLSSSATVTLEQVLAGTGSRIRTTRLRRLPRSERAR